MQQPCPTKSARRRPTKNSQLKPDEFDPTNEKAFYDEINMLLRRLIALNKNDKILKYVIHRIAGTRIQQALGALNTALNWPEVRNQLACKLFKYSKQLDDVDKQSHYSPCNQSRRKTHLARRTMGYGH